MKCYRPTNLSKHEAFLRAKTGSYLSKQLLLILWSFKDLKFLFSERFFFEDVYNWRLSLIFVDIFCECFCVEYLSQIFQSCFVCIKENDNQLFLMFKLYCHDIECRLYLYFNKKLVLLFSCRSQNVYPENTKRRVKYHCAAGLLAWIQIICYGQQIILFGRIQVSKTGGHLYSNTYPYLQWVISGLSDA